LLLLEDFIIGNVIFACHTIFSTLCIGKSLGKQDYYDLTCWHFDTVWLVSCHLKNLLEFLKNLSWISPGNCLAGFVDALFLLAVLLL